MFNKLKSKKSWTYKLITILLLSVAYGIAFYFAYNRTKHGIVSYINLIPAFLVSWLWGARAGLIITSLDILVWTNITINFLTPEISIFMIDALLGITMHFTFCLIVGSFSTLTKKLRHEITERKSAEEQLKQYQNHLEEMVKKRTSELRSANERLSQAEKMEAIGQLAGGIAHDFNNQLTIVLGYTEILKNRLKDNPQLQQYLQQIHSSGKRASDLTKQLLAFARKGVYKMQTVDLNNLTKEIEALLSRGINKNINIVTKFEAVGPNVWGGTTQLQNAILNLSLNGCDAMENGGTLTLKTSNVWVDQDYCNSHSLNIKTGDYIAVTVQDTGIGMDSEVKRHLFEPFFTTKSEGKGTGMGLAAVYGIVKSHNGGVFVESEPHKGSSFTLLFPRTSKIIISDNPENTLISIKKNMHILIIDDEKDVAGTIKDMLCDPMFTVTIAYNGQEAIDIYRSSWQTIDSVIIDMVMPGLDGYQTFTALKEINPLIKAIISSGYTLNKKIALTLQEGASAFLQKPYTKNELINKVQVIIDNKDGSEDSNKSSPLV